MARAAVVPLPLLVERVHLHAPPRVAHRAGGAEPTGRGAGGAGGSVPLPPPPRRPRRRRPHGPRRGHSPLFALPGRYCPRAAPSAAQVPGSRRAPSPALPHRPLPAAAISAVVEAASRAPSVRRRRHVLQLAAQPGLRRADAPPASSRLAAAGAAQPRERAPSAPRCLRSRLCARRPVPPRPPLPSSSRRRRHLGSPLGSGARGDTQAAAAGAPPEVPGARGAGGGEGGAAGGEVRSGAQLTRRNPLARRSARR